MKAFTQSELAEKLNVTGIQTIYFDKSVVCTMRPKYMKEYNIECMGISINEKESKKTEVFIFYKFENQMYKMNWSQFKSSEKIKIQKVLF